MDVTPDLSIPYPEPTDPITDYPALGQDLAERLELLLTPIIDHTVTGSVLASFDSDTILGGVLPTWARSLRFILTGRLDAAVTQNFVLARFNNDSGANYQSGRLENSSGSVAIAGEGLAGTSIAIGRISGASAPAGMAGQIEGIIGDYRGTTFHKLITSLSVAHYGTATGNWTINPASGIWRNTAAITRLQIIPGGGNFAIGTRLLVYGLL